MMYSMAPTRISQEGRGLHEEAEDPEDHQTD
jgi:hypothetical protein